MFLFFFKQKTAYDMRISDWSSDVCASDQDHERSAGAGAPGAGHGQAQATVFSVPSANAGKATHHLYVLPALDLWSEKESAGLRTLSRRPDPPEERHS